MEQEMRTFAAADLQRDSAEVQRAAMVAPIALTYHEKPRFVMMNLEDYARLIGAKLKAYPENLPDSVTERLQAIADQYPDENPELLGDLESVMGSGGFVEPRT